MRTSHRVVACLAVLLAILLPSASLAAISPGDARDGAAASFDTPAPTERPNAQRTPRPTAKPDRTAKPDQTAEPVIPALLPPVRPTLTVAYQDPGVAGQAPLLLAREAGYFEDVGLTDVVIVAVPSNALDQIRRGTLDIAVVDARQAAEANAADAQLRSIAGYQNYQGEDGAYGGDLLLATPGLVANEPSTVIAFLSAYIRALQDLADPDGAQAALKTIQASDVAVDPAESAQWSDLLTPFAPFDGGFGDVSQGGGLGELEAYLTPADGDPADLDALIARATLNLAQASLPVAPNPAGGFAGPPASEVTVAVPNAAGPIAAASDAGYFADVGFDVVDVMNVEEPLLGVLTGEVDFGVVSMADAADGISQGLPIKAIAGHQNYGADGSYGGDVVITTTDLIANEPAAVAAFLVAYVRALQDAAADVDSAAFAPFDGGFGAREVGGGLGELSAYVAEAVGTAVDMDALIALAPLEFAQSSLGLAANPSTAPLPTDVATEEEGA